MRTTPIRIVSLNVWGGAMFDALAAWLADGQADIYCFQEVTRTADLGGWTRYDDPDRSLPQRANLFADLADALPSHVGYFRASDAGPVKNQAGHIYTQEFGIAAFVHQHHTVLTETARFAHGAFTEHASWPRGGRPRIAQAIRVSAAHRSFTVVHFHGLRDPLGKFDTPERIAQATRLAELVRDTQGPNDHLIVCGDFNVLPDSSTFDILAGIGLTDLVGNADTRTSRYTKPNRHANYMLVSDPEDVIAFTAAQEPEVSDHRILTLDI